MKTNRAPESPDDVFPNREIIKATFFFLFFFFTSTLDQLTVYNSEKPIENDHQTLTKHFSIFQCFDLHFQPVS